MILLKLMTNCIGAPGQHSLPNYSDTPRHYQMLNSNARTAISNKQFAGKKQDRAMQTESGQPPVSTVSLR
jgi:hypothetical protein